MPSVLLFSGLPLDVREPDLAVSKAVPLEEGLAATTCCRARAALSSPCSLSSSSPHLHLVAGGTFIPRLRLSPSPPLSSYQLTSRLFLPLTRPTQELLTADPTRLPAASVAVTALHNSAGKFLGTFLVEVGSDADAERVRLQYSGQVIDGCE